MTRQILLCSAAVGCLASLMPMVASAATQDTDKIEEIVVTAQKRTENIQTVPIAMTALTADDLASKAVVRQADLQYASPALTVTDAGLTQSVNIRGIGLASGSPNAANGVATYVDGVFQPPIVSSSSYYDLADIEVLRGPQGTFVGSNSTGGAIFIKSKDPSLNGFGGTAEIEGGSYNALGLQAAVNVPINDTLAMRVAINRQSHDSYYVDHTYGNNPDRLAEGAGRFGLLWKPDDSFQAVFKIEAVDKNTGGYAYQPVPGTAYGATFSQPSIYDLSFNAPELNHEKAQQADLNMQYVFGDGTTIKSITGYENKKINNKYDVDATATASLTEAQFVRERVYTQEVDVLSPSDGPFTWVAGGYAQRNRIDVLINNAVSGATTTNILIANKKTTLGAFAQAGYEITPDVVFTLGGRYSTYKVLGSGNVRIANGIAVADTGGHESDGRPTGKANLDWHMDKDNLLYGFVARGYKSGGYNTQTSVFQPETVWDYEAGWKSTLLNGHLKTQLDGFYNSYNNFQFDTVNTVTGQSAVQNVSSATIKGLEAQAQGKMHGFGYDASIAYVQSTLATYTVIDQNLLTPGSLHPQCAVGQIPGNTCTNYTNATKTVTGASNLLSPKITFNAGAEYTFTVNDEISITPRLNYAYTSSENGSPSQESYYHIAGHGLLSSLVRADYNNWELQFYGTNLLAKKYITGFIISGSAGEQFYGAPQSFGARLSTEF